MITDIKPFLKYYIGQPCQVKRYGPAKIICVYEDAAARVELHNGKVLSFGHTDIIPKLRRIESLRDEEQIMILSLSMPKGWKGIELLKQSSDDWAMRIEDNDVDRKTLYVSKKKLEPKIFHYLLLLGVWLFGDEAFDNGLIIDAATIKTEG